MGERDPRAGAALGSESLQVMSRADRREQQNVRIAWYYYMERMTQSEVAQRIGISRMMVNRILAQCLAEGVVQIRINARLASSVALEEELVRRFALRDAVVLPSPARGEEVAAILGAEAGHYLSERLRPGISVGLGWGRALWSSLRTVRRRKVPGLAIVALLGGLTRRAAVNTYECASRLADIVSADCYYLAAPAFAGSEESRDMLFAQEVIAEVYERARHCDVALISAGELAPSSTNYKLGLLTREDLLSLREAGAVGDVLCCFIDAAGRPVDHPLNRRVIALRLADLKRIPQVILLGGGRAKAAVIGAALRAGYAHVLITDEDCARALLACPGRTEARPRRPREKTAAAPTATPGETR